MSGSDLPDVSIELLGQFRLCIRGVAINLSAPRQRALIAYLVLCPGPVGREQLASMLWGEKTDHQAKQNLRQLLLEVRKNLESAGADIMQTDRVSVSMDRSRVQVDVDRFRCCARSDASCDLSTAADLYSGDLLQDFYLDVESFDEWLRAERDRLRLKAAEVFERLAHCYSAKGQKAEAVGAAERLVKLDSMRESAHRFLIRQLATHRGADAALAYAENFIKELAVEFGAKPGAETTRLVADIRAGSIAGAVDLNRSLLDEIHAPSLAAPKTVAEGERKLVTVLFARLSSSMELLADRDPEEAWLVLDPMVKHMVEAVHHFHGTVNQVMGDGIMAIFGAPVAHEDHAVRACNAALRMHDSMRGEVGRFHHLPAGEPRIRVGLNSGEVLVRAIACDLRMDYTALGHTAQLGDLIAQRAEGGVTLMTRATFALAQGYVEVKPREPALIAGLAKAVDVYELSGVDATRSRLRGAALRGLTPFTGRQREMGELRRAIASAGRGKGQIVAIVGDPGVGKSRLSRQFIESDRTAGWLVLQSRAFSYSQATPFQPFIDLLRAYFEVEWRDDTQAVRGKVHAKLRSLKTPVETSLPPLLSLLDVPVEDLAWENLAPAQRRRRTLEAVKDLLFLLSQTTPLLLLIEDLHWIDLETEALIDGLVGSLPGNRLLLVVNYRSEYHDGWIGRPQHRQVRVDTLRDAGADELLLTLLGANESVEPIKRVLIERAEGNPLFLEELVRALADAGALAGNRGAYHLAAEATALPLAPTIQGILAARVDQLSADDKRLLQAAAVIGREFAFAPLQAITDLPDAELRTALRRLQSADFLRQSTTPDVEYTFKHALTHDVAYGTLLQDRRRVLHGRLVAAIERLYSGRLEEHVDRLAHHAFRGEMWATAVRYLQRAGTKANARSAFREAKTFFEQGLVALTHMPKARESMVQSIDCRLQLRQSLLALADHGRIEEILTEARRLAMELDEHGCLVRISGAFTTLRMAQGRHEEAVVFARESARTDEVGVKAHGLAAMGSNVQSLGRHGEAVSIFRNVIGLVPGILARERFGFVLHPSIFARAGMAISLAEMGAFDEALAMGKNGVAIAESLQSARGASLAYALIGLGRVHLRQGSVADALSVLERDLQICRELELTHYALVVGPLLASTYILAGKVDAAVKLLERTKDIEDELDIRNMRAMTVGVLSEAVLVSGDVVRAAALAQYALEVAQRQRQRGFEAWALRLKGEIAANQIVPDRPAAIVWNSEALSTATECGMRPLAAHCHVALGRLSDGASQKERARAQRHLATGLAMYRDMGMRFWLPAAEAERLRVMPSPTQYVSDVRVISEALTKS